MKNVDCFLIHLLFAINLSRYLVFIVFLLKVNNVVDHNVFKILSLVLWSMCHVQSMFIFSMSKIGIKHRTLNFRNMGLVNKLDVTPNVPRTKSQTNSHCCVIWKRSCWHLYNVVKII
jgi:hypothetical protein